jgi:hypothetical protein
MIWTNPKRLRTELAAFAVAMIVVVPAHAGTIDINLTGFRVDYSTDDDQLHDRMTEAGGNLDPGEAVLLTGTEFMLDGLLTSQFNASDGEQTYADLLVEDIDPTLTLPTTALAPSVSTGDNNGSFGLDWFFDDAGTLRTLRLNFEEVTVALIYNGIHIRPTLVVTGSTTNWTQSNLPSGLAFDPGSAITFSYTTTNTMAFDVVGNNFVDLLGSGGVMQISGQGDTVVPEPTTMVISSAIGAVGLLSVVRRRRTRK